MKTAACMAAAFALASMAGRVLAQSGVQQDPVPIRIVVQQLDVGAPVPLAKVSGFTILRNNLPYAGAVCPDASDSKGQLTCMLTCAPPNKNATLLLMPPRRESAAVVTGMRVPAAPEVKVDDCRIATPQPVVLVYRTVRAQLAELEVAAPEVYRAATMVVDGAVRVKPFAAAAPALEHLAARPEHRRAIQELGELGRLANERPVPDRWGSDRPIGNLEKAGLGAGVLGSLAGGMVGAPPAPGGAVPGTSPGALHGRAAAGASALQGASIAEYAVGTSSILLKAQTSEVMGSQTANDIVKLSAKPADLSSSIDNVTKALRAKTVVNQEEAQLERAVKELQRSQ